MKYLVETTGAFALHDTLGQQTIQAYRPTVVTKTPFIDSMRGLKLNVLETLADDASDSQLQVCKSTAELEAAIAGLPREKAGGKPKIEDPIVEPPYDPDPIEVAKAPAKKGK